MSTPIDDRLFVRVAVDLPSNKKLVDATPAVKWLYAAGFCVSGRDLSDGIVRPTVVCAEADVPTSTSKQLLKRGLWHAPGHDCERCVQPPKAHVVIHDYLLHNRSKDEADEQKRKKSAAGKKGAAARWGTPDDSSDGKCHSSSHDSSDGTSIAESESESEQSVVTYLRQSPKQTREVGDDGLTKIMNLTKGSRAHAQKVAELVLSKAPGDVGNPERYVLAAIRQEPELYRASRSVTKQTCCPKPGHESFLADACGACKADELAGTA